jgi:diguanylate cyclase (GGDEF)-like protein
MNKKRTILVIDDSSISLNHLVRILEDEYIVLVASGGVEGVQVAKAAKPDIILSDIVMPQMDGYEVLSALRELRETKDIPVVFITSLDQECNEAKGLELGASDYISKPFNPTIVKLRVRLLLKLVEQMQIINEMGMVDTTTRLPNRHYFDVRLKEEWKRAAGEDSTLGILRIDIDKIRSYNTIHGYRAGDEMLVKVAEIISDNTLVQPGNIAARWAFGGFVVLLQKVTDSECNSIGENIRKAVEGAIIKVAGGEDTFVTISVGACSVKPAAGEISEEKFISNADSALYLAKELGCNRVVVHS